VTVLLAIDPGACAGWAYHTDKGIVACGIVHSGDAYKNGLIYIDHPTFEPDALAVEVPQIYPKMQGDPNDLIKLAFHAGRLLQFQFSVSRIQEIKVFLPREWKGQMKKDVCAARVWDKLSPDEQAVVSRGGRGLAQSYLHNMMDAVGIALHASGRRLT